MIGIVLWSDPADGKAVFWCEDQGDLAYFDGDQMLSMSEGMFHAGDMVQFDVTADCKMRKAHQPRLLHEQACSDLPDTLRLATPVAASAPTEGQSAKIIPFKATTGGTVRAKHSARKA